ncbi:unnamed protein product, partial [marine sediment metagenome]
MLKPYYQDNYVTIYLGDCREILPELPKVGLVLTDPPYGLDNIKRNPSRSVLAVSKDYGLGEWDTQVIDYNVLKLCLSYGERQIVFGGNYYPLPPARCWLVWDKENGENDFADCELAWTNLDKAIRIYRYRWQGMLQRDMKNKERHYHPTQKPVSVMKWCILQAGDGIETIIDPFMGSGSTLRASKELNRKCIGIEIEEKYCEIAAKRCSQGVFEL